MLRSVKKIIKRLDFYLPLNYNIVNIKVNFQRRKDIMIKTIAKPAERKITACGECRSTCQSACKTSCTVGNQSCERITREQNPEKEVK